MGLCLNGNYSLAYSTFSKWRKMLCETQKLGLLSDYEGYGGRKKFPFHPLTPLLDHDDNTGTIAWQLCNNIADVLASYTDVISVAIRTQCMISYANQSDLRFG